MKRFLKLTVLCAIAFSFTMLANESFAKGLVKAKPARTHKHRINLYPNNSNPNKDPNYGNPVDPPYGGSGPVGTPPKGNPIKPHPRPIVGVPPIGVLTGAGKTQ